MNVLIINPVNDEWLTSVLSALGGTPGEVAATLRAAGFSGGRGSGVRCPVALYVRAKAKERVPSASRVFVWSGSDAVSVRIAREDGEVLVRVTPPLAVSAFIEAFDSGGDYADLDDAGT